MSVNLRESKKRKAKQGHGLSPGAGPIFPRQALLGPPQSVRLRGRFPPSRYFLRAVARKR